MASFDELKRQLHEEILNGPCRVSQISQEIYKTYRVIGGWAITHIGGDFIIGHDGEQLVIPDIMTNEQIIARLGSFFNVRLD